MKYLKYLLPRKSNICYLFTTTLAVIDGAKVIEIEGLLFLGFGPMHALHGKLVFPVFPIK